jgi:TonB-linked SusC/RagA family outer membrane protein
MKLDTFILSRWFYTGWFTPKVLLVMKLTTFFIMVVLLQVSAKTYSQINLDFRNAPLTKVLNAIKSQTGYTFFYDTEDVKNVTVSIQVSNASLDQALSICFKDTPVTFKVVQNNIVLKRKDESFFSKLSNLITLPVSVSGVVSDNTGPLPGVTVRIKGTNRVTTTDDKGEFSFSSVKQNDIIVFSYIGYKPQEIIVKNETIFNIKLEQANADLQQLVVIGYGTSKKKDLTGSVSTVTAKDIEDVPFTTVDNALAGKAAGVQVTKTDGSPGGAVRIRIRGSSSLLGGNDPLYVIDGVPVQVQSNFIAPGYTVGDPVANAVAGGNSSGNNAGLSTAFVNGLNSLGGLNVDDIESITILKDASSTAIYGSKAANGVVIITTKRGKKDMPPQITASYYSTVTSPETPHLLNSSQYRILLTEAAQNDYNMRTSPQGIAVVGPGNIPTDDIGILNNPSTYFGTANTNWIKQVTRTTISNNAELSVQGGGNLSKYFSSISYNSTPGVVNATDFQRVSGKINLENEIGPKFRFITNMILGYTNQNIGDGAYSQALRARPDWAPYDANGNFINFDQQNDLYSRGFLNPVALLTATNNAKIFNLLGSVSGIYDITKALQFKSTASLNMQTYNQRNYMPSYLELGGFYGNVANNGGIGSNSNSRLTNWFIENTLTYNKRLDKNNTIDILAGQSYETRKTSFFSATGIGYPNDNVLTSLSSAVTPLLVRGDDPSAPQSYLLSFYLRANYSLLDKYLFTFTGRTDGSSKFGPDNKFGYFPSAAVAWRISQENFLKNVKWIDDIKFRGSYGLTGTQNIGDQMYRTLYSPLSFGGSSALVPTQLGNQGIKWESTREADAGIDISLFNNRLTATVDYYNKQTSGDLLSLPIAASSSYSSLLTNAVGIKNTGVEVTIGGDIIRARNFKWSASVNVTWNTSLVTRLNSNADLSQIGSLTGLESFGSKVTYGTGNTVLIQGKPLGLITGEIFTGIIKTQAQLDAYNKQLGPQNLAYNIPLSIGDPMFKLDPSTASQGYENPYTNAIIGNGAPKYYGGITQGFTYKKFDLQLYFTYSEGGQLLWADHVTSMGFIGTGNANVVMLNRYTPSNTNTDQPRLILNSGGYTASNLDVFNSSYLKLRTLTLNYRFDKALWMQKVGMKTASLFISATNVFTITKYPGNDPETSDDAYSVAGGYFDVSNYPSVKTFSLGLKAGF